MKAAHPRSVLLAIALPLALGVSLAYSADRSAESIVDTVCANCHKAGTMGAPVIGDKEAWAKRKSQGLTQLTGHALKGIRNMPAHGGNAGLNATELERAVTYMVNQSGGNWVEPVNTAKPKAPRSGEQLVKAKCGEC